MIEYSQLHAVALSGTDTLVGSGVNYMRTILSLAFCLALGVGAAFVLRHFHKHRPSTQSRKLRILESLRLDSRTSVHLIQCGNQQTLLACHSHGLAMTLIDPTAPDSASVTPGDTA